MRFQQQADWRHLLSYRRSKLLHSQMFLQEHFDNLVCEICHFFQLQNQSSQGSNSKEQVIDLHAASRWRELP